MVATLRVILRQNLFWKITLLMIPIAVITKSIHDTTAIVLLLNFITDLVHKTAERVWICYFCEIFKTKQKLPNDLLESVMIGTMCIVIANQTEASSYIYNNNSANQNAAKRIDERGFIEQNTNVLDRIFLSNCFLKWSKITMFY